MKNVVLLLAPMFPTRNHNANLLLRTAPHLENCDLSIICQSLVKSKDVPARLDDIPTHFVQKRKWFDRVIFHSLKMFIGRQRADDLLCITRIRLYAFFHRIFNKSDVIIATFQMQAQADAASRIKKPKKILYLMDPTGPMFRSNQDVSNEPKWVINMLKNYDVILTTKFIKEAMESKGYLQYTKKVTEISFPLITEQRFPLKNNNGTITLLFAGTIYPKLRSPEYFLNTIRFLDERFRVIFIGKGCEEIANHIENTKAEIITLPPVNYDELQKITSDSDILVNIGNSVPVHMPSKTIEYINTGKPIVNFYKFDECPTLYYTKRYPLCLNIDEQNNDVESAATKLMKFCESSINKQLDKDWILSEYNECTPQSVAKTISLEIQRQKR